jgi:hypothetical protein
MIEKYLEWIVRQHWKIQWCRVCSGGTSFCQPGSQGVKMVIRVGFPYCQSSATPHPLILRSHGYDRNELRNWNCDLQCSLYLALLQALQASFVLNSVFSFSHAIYPHLTSQAFGSQIFSALINDFVSGYLNSPCLDPPLFLPFDKLVEVIAVRTLSTTWTRRGYHRRRRDG